MHRFPISRFCVPPKVTRMTDIDNATSTYCDRIQKSENCIVAALLRFSVGCVLLQVNFLCVKKGTRAISKRFTPKTSKHENRVLNCLEQLFASFTLYPNFIPLFHYYNTTFKIRLIIIHYV